MAEPHVDRHALVCVVQQCRATIFAFERSGRRESLPLLPIATSDALKTACEVPEGHVRGAGMAVRGRWRRTRQSKPVMAAMLERIVLVPRFLQEGQHRIAQSAGQHQRLSPWPSRHPSVVRKLQNVSSCVTWRSSLQPFSPLGSSGMQGASCKAGRSEPQVVRIGALSTSDAPPNHYSRQGYPAPGVRVLLEPDSPPPVRAGLGHGSGRQQGRPSSAAAK